MDMKCGGSVEEVWGKRGEGEPRYMHLLSMGKYLVS